MKVLVGDIKRQILISMIQFPERICPFVTRPKDPLIDRLVIRRRVTASASPLSGWVPSLADVLEFLLLLLLFDSFCGRSIPNHGGRRFARNP